MRRKFKEPKLQSVYDWFRANPGSEQSKSLGGLHSAYVVGRYVSQDRPVAVRNSMAYAAWAAGVDEKRATQ